MRLAVLLCTALLLAAPATAVVQNGTSPAEQVGEGELGITSTGETARTSQSFGGEGGPQYDLMFTVTNTTPDVPGDKITNVTVRRQSATLTGRIQVPTPCHELSTSAQETGGELAITVKASSSADACVQQVVTKHYRMTVAATAPFRLEVRHGTTGMEVRTVETPGYAPPTDRGLIASFLSFLRSLF